MLHTTAPAHHLTVPVALAAIAVTLRVWPARGGDGGGRGVVKLAFGLPASRHHGLLPTRQNSQGPRPPGALAARTRLPITAAATRLTEEGRPSTKNNSS